MCPPPRAALRWLRIVVEMSCAGLRLLEGLTDDVSNDPQRGVGLDQTPLGIATTSRLGTTRMLDLPDEGAQIRFSDLWGPDPFAMWAAHN